MLIGIIASLLGAVGQAYNYAVTKDCQIKYRIVGFNLLACTFMFMAILLCFPFVLLGYFHYLEASQIILVIETNIPFLLGQYFMFCALRHSDASIVSPLLALKIPVLCLISYFFFDLNLGAQQYAAIAAILAAACVFSMISGKIKIRALFYLVLCTTCYVCSDIGITSLARSIPVESRFEQVMIATCINYIAAGLFFVPFCPVKGITLKMIWQSKAPAVTWIVSSSLGVVGFNYSGLVSGNIIQSLRGAFGVVISFIFYRHEMVGSLSGRTFALKLLLSILMVLAVAAFYVPIF